MRVARFACVLFALMVWAVYADASRLAQDVRVLSVRWALYYALTYRISPDLVLAIIDVESSWNPSAVSDKGAVGLTQLMPQTAARFGVRNRFRLDDNIRGGVEYLACLDREFRGDLRLVVAAYYVGEGPIRQRRLDFSSPDVQAYVKRVAARYRARRRCARYFQTANGIGGGE